MTSAERAGSALLLLTLGLPVAAQEAPLGDEVERLEAENAVLRHELRALRSRLDSLERFVLDRLGAEPRVDAVAGRVPERAPPAPRTRAQVTQDRSEVQMPDLRLADGVGGASVAELAKKLQDGLRMLDGSTMGCSALLVRLAAFEPGPGRAFLVPPEAWRLIRPEGAPESPTAEALEAMFHHLALGSLGLLSEHRELSKIERLPDVLGAPRAALIFPPSHDAPTRAPLRIELSAVRINGRFLLVGLTTPWFEENARTALLTLKDALGTKPRPGTPRVLPDLVAFARQGVVGATTQDERSLHLPLYTLALSELAGGEWGAVATTLDGWNPDLLMGPIPGEHDPRESPYKIRTRKAGTPVALQLDHGSTLAEPGYLGVTVGNTSIGGGGIGVPAVEVTVVTPDSPAAAAGVRTGDVILTVSVRRPGGGPPTRVWRSRAFEALLAGLEPGTKIVLGIQREASRRDEHSTFETPEITLRYRPYR